MAGHCNATQSTPRWSAIRTKEEAPSMESRTLAGWQIESEIVATFLKINWQTSKMPTELFGTDWPEYHREKIDFCPKFVPKAGRLPDVTQEAFVNQ
jgi:hypothetical protein